MAARQTNVHIVVGNRDQRMRSVIDRLLGPKGDVLNSVRLDFAETGLDEISTAILSLPFMGAGSSARTVLIDNLPPPTRSGPFWRWLAESQSQIPATTTVVLAVGLEGVSGRERGGRERAVRGLASDSVSVQILPDLAGQGRTGSDARRWVEQLARANGITLEAAAVERLVQRAEIDGNVLSREVEKLAALVGFQGRITASDVQAVDPLPAHVVVWDYIDAVVVRDPALAVKLLTDLLREGEAPEALLAMLVARVRQLIAIRSLLAGGASYEQTARRARTSPGMARRAAPQAMAFSAEELADMLHAIVDLDIREKSGRIPHGRLASGLEALTIRFCFRSFRSSARNAPNSAASQLAKTLA